MLALMLSGCSGSGRTDEAAIQMQDVPLASVEAEVTPQIEDTPPIHFFAAIASGEGRTYALVATMVPNCSGDSILSPCASASRPDAEQSVEEDKPPVARSPFVLPDGYQTVSTSRYTLAIPDDWHIEKKAGDDWFTFLRNGEQVGEADILGWFDEETWRDFKPNHSEQTGFVKRDDLLADQRGDVHLYRIQLIHTKPAADQDPDWKYEETRWYVADKASGLAYGFHFASETVDERVMETIVSSFRLNGAGVME